MTYSIQTAANTFRISLAGAGQMPGNRVATTNREDLYKLLSSDRECVLRYAVHALRGQPVDATLLGMLPILLQSRDLASRLEAMHLLADDLTPAYAERKLQLLLDSIETADRIDRADTPDVHENLTLTESFCEQCIDSLARMQGIDKALAEVKVTGRAWRCVSLARGERGHYGARADVLAVLADPEAGILRARAASALELIGRPEDQPALLEATRSDPLREAARRALRAIEIRTPDWWMIPAAQVA